MRFVKNKKFTSVCLTVLLTGILFSATSVIAEEADKKEQEIFYIYPDGTMEFRGRIKNKEDVVIYEDGRGGERAAIKIIVPRNPLNRYPKQRHSHFYRDNITVERIEIDMPVVR